MSAFAVFGNPIKHSKSAEIYALFANEAKICNKYDLILSSEKNFKTMLIDFFNSKGLGANITVPFKKRALFLCDKLTERAMVANSVNTIKKMCDNTLLGDNTDGVGLISDLKRLQWVNEDNTFFNSNNIHKYSMNNILIIGSGGAAKGIISTLLNIKKCHINIINRTFSNAKKLVRYYHSIGRQNISCIDLTKLSSTYNKITYNLVINATSSSMYHDIPKISSSIITRYTKCYDLFYQKKNTVFIEWCKKNGAQYYSDGLGMLVKQAAYAFNLWHNFFPDTISVLNNLRNSFL